MKNTLPKLSGRLAALLLVSAALVSIAAPPHTGIQGQSFLIVSYGTHSQTPEGGLIGIPAVQLPAPTSFTVLSKRTSREVTRVRTDATGKFSVSLPAGVYAIVPDTLILQAGCSVPTGSFDVTVSPGEFTPAYISYFQESPCTISGTVP